MYTIEELQSISDKVIGRCNQDLDVLNPDTLYAPVKYSLEMGGKRLRPVMLLMAYNLFREELDPAFPAAAAIEVFHNFTLLHDDIMDKAGVRRNKPTVHVKFSENAAILSGDAMAFLSYRYLLGSNQERLPEVLDLFTSTALQVCEGQQFDMDFEHRLDVTEAEYIRMIQLKTAVLLACSLKAGALLAQAPFETAEKLYKLGLNLGLAFQIQDDWLDAFGSQQAFGKLIGGDILSGKKTYLLIKALESAETNMRMQLLDLLKDRKMKDRHKIDAVIDIYNQLGIPAIAEKKAAGFFAHANTILKELTVDTKRKARLYELIDKMQKRSY